MSHSYRSSTVLLQNGARLDRKKLSRSLFQTGVDISPKGRTLAKNWQITTFTVSWSHRGRHFQVISTRFFFFFFFNNLYQDRMPPGFCVPPVLSPPSNIPILCIRIRKFSPSKTIHSDAYERLNLVIKTSVKLYGRTGTSNSGSLWIATILKINKRFKSLPPIPPSTLYIYLLFFLHIWMGCCVPPALNCLRMPNARKKIFFVFFF